VVNNKSKTLPLFSWLPGYPVAKIKDANRSLALVISMPTSTSPSARKGFDYTSLDPKTSEFVQKQTGEIRVLMKRTVESIFEIGQKLIEVKKRLGHGRFGDWLEAEFDWSTDTAQRFMRVAQVFAEKPQVALFAPSALYELAAPSTPEAARSEALARAEAGEPITYTAAKAIKQKYATRPTKPKPEPEPVSPPQLGSKLEIMAIHRQALPLLLPEATKVIPVPPFAQFLPAPLPSQPNYAPDVPGVWWQLGGRHFLYCGNPNSPEFLARITEEKVSLLLVFPPNPGWLPAIQATTRFISTEYLPQGRNLDQLDEFLESSVLFNSNLGDLVVSCFLPSPEILSVINRLDRRGLFAEPDSKRCNAVISDWKRAGLRAERLAL